MWSPNKPRNIILCKSASSAALKVIGRLVILSSCVHLLAFASLRAAGQSTQLAYGRQQQAASISSSKTDGPSSQRQASDRLRQPTRQASASEDDPRDGPVYLESMADLDHSAYLAMRNYNLTDERLLQLSWLMGPVALSSHKQHSDDASAHFSDLSASRIDVKGRLALMLESLMMHLRSGHLRRMGLDELEQAVQSLNLTEPLEELRRRRAVIRAAHGGVLGTNARMSALTNETTGGEPRDAAAGAAATLRSELDSAPESSDEDGELRCLYLVTLYKSELSERSKADQSARPQSRVEYESDVNLATQQQQQPVTTKAANESTSPRPDLVPQQAPLVGAEESNQTAEDNLGASEQLAGQAQVNDMRLMDLCKLAVVCRSSDELIEIISKPWLATTDAAAQENRLHKLEPRETRRRSSSSSDSRQPEQLERDSSEDSGEQQLQRSEEGRVDSRARKSLRDSLSMSLAKLCPLILLPLHEDVAKCMVRRDDRPPMMTVWAFATLFVTIVCFCSLIGLSITPLLGQSHSDSSTGGSEASGPAAGFAQRAKKARAGSRSPAAGRSSQARGRRHKASLTLFEGLAVGSLVGSALFSLIPQAFELQERESNRGFLLKAFIIFSGIYLFFLSERIMRIILDTRQKRKKKRLNHQSSTTMAVEMPGNVQHFAHAPTSLQDQAPNRHSASTRHNCYPSVPLAGASLTSTSRQRLSAASRGSDAAKALAKQSGPDGKSASGHRLKLTSTSTFDAKHQDASSSHKATTRRTKQGASGGLLAVAQPLIIKSAGGLMHTSTKKVASGDDQERQVALRDSSAVSMQTKQSGKGVLTNARHSHAGPGQQSKVTPSSASASLKRRRKLQRPSQRRKQNQSLRTKTRGRLTKQAQARNKLARSRSHESDLNDYYHGADSSQSSSSTSSTSSSSSFSSYALTGRRSRALAQDGLVMLHTEDSRADYSSSSSSSRSLSRCSSCSSFDRDFCGAVLSKSASDSDDDNVDQRRAVSKQMSAISRRYSARKQQLRTTFRLEAGQPEDNSSKAQHHQSETGTGYGFDMEHGMQHADMRHMGPIYVNHRGSQGADRGNNRKRDISTVAWMIVLGDGLHNFIDGISIGAAFSESILSGISISVAVICEEFPHELGDFAVLVSSGMTVRQALGYNFLSACTCYLGMAVGIILGDVTDGASYISALAAGVFLYIALVDMMGELSAALESSSRDSIARTLKLLLLQNVGIAIGISIIFVLSFIDF